MILFCGNSAKDNLQRIKILSILLLSTGRAGVRISAQYGKEARKEYKLFSGFFAFRHISSPASNTMILYNFDRNEVIAMVTRVNDLRNKEVINVKDGTKLGYVDDVDVNTCTAEVLSLVVYGRAKCFGLLGREEDIVIRWSEIEVIGEDTVLVCFEQGHKVPGKKPGFFSRLFS